MLVILLLACAATVVVVADDTGGTDLPRARHAVERLAAAAAHNRFDYVTWPCLGNCKGHTRAIQVAGGGVGALTAKLARYLVARRPALADAAAARAALKLVGWPDRDARKYRSALQAYETLTVALWRATQDPTFRAAHARPALWLEFGVYRGTSINATAALRDTFSEIYAPRVVGFDTFEGIPQEWKTSKRQARPKYPQGMFSWREDTGTLTPPVRKGVELVTGLFNETLGPFLDASSGSVILVNIDNDLYEGALEVLELLLPRFVVGTRLHFHELVEFKRGSCGDEMKCVRPDQEMRALYRFLRRHPCVGLALDPVRGGRPRAQPVVFDVARMECDGAGPA